MFLDRLLRARAASGSPVRVGLVGAGKFGSMFLAQARTTPGLHVLAVADLSTQRAIAALQATHWQATHWPADALTDVGPAKALREGTTWVADDADALINAPGLDVLVEATGHPGVGIRHALAAYDRGAHVVMVNVEADALAGPLLTKRAREAGVVSTYAFGDQPALIAELVSWARTCGLEVVCAGKGTKHLPSFHHSTPDTVWDHYGVSAEDAARAGMNAQMFNSFLDGTKSAIEMAAVASAFALSPAQTGLGFPPCGVDDLPHVLRPLDEGGTLTTRGSVEVVSSLERDGRPVFRDLRWGVYVVFAANGTYAADCFRQYGVVTDSTGRYAALYRPSHLIGLEAGVSVAAAALRGEDTGAAEQWRRDAVAVAKRDLALGDVLDGEGGFTVYGKLAPAVVSHRDGLLPIGLAHGVRIAKPLARDECVRWSDVDTSGLGSIAAEAMSFRHQMEKECGAVE